ncbi:UNVERIFIED_CONTAM: structural protein, partial [Bacillus mycoides]
MKHELTAPVTHKNEEKRIVFGPVLVPDEPDSDGDVVTAEKIEEVAHKFLEQYGNIDLQHTLNNVGKVVESYILPFDWE